MIRKTLFAAALAALMAVPSFAEQTPDADYEKIKDFARKLIEEDGGKDLNPEKLREKLKGAGFGDETLDKIDLRSLLRPKPTIGEIIQRTLERLQEDGSTLKQVSPDEFRDLLKETLKKEGYPEDALKEFDIESFLTDLGGAQERSSSLEQQFYALLEAHRPVTQDAFKSTAVFYDDKDRMIAMGTVVRADGLVLTKASEVTEAIEKGGLRCELATGEEGEPKVLETWTDHDLALVKVPVEGLIPIVWSDQPPPEPGSFIAALGMTQDAIAIGVVSVAPRSLLETGQAFLGVGLESVENGLRVTNVSPNTAAAECGLKIGDIIATLDGLRFDNVPSFAVTISRHAPGDEVVLSVIREDKTEEIKAKLGERRLPPGASEGGGRFQRMNQMGSSLSDRRHDFPWIMQTDLPVNSNQCGSAIVDLTGRAIGMIVARAGRVNTYAVPCTTIVKILGDIAKIDASDHALVAAAKKQEKEFNQKGPFADDFRRVDRTLDEAEELLKRAAALLEK